MKAPCQDCEWRHRNCHSHCAEYKEFQRKNDRIKIKKRVDAITMSYVAESMAERSHKKKGR